jgi:hypothetical protein
VRKSTPVSSVVWAVVMRRERFAYRGLALLLLGAVCQGCATRYAYVHVKAVDETNSPVSLLPVFSGADGQLLGETAFDLPMRKTSGSSNPILSLLIHEGDMCPAYWQIVSVTRWARSWREARDALYKNEVLFRVRRCAGTPRSTTTGEPPLNERR